MERLVEEAILLGLEKMAPCCCGVTGCHCLLLCDANAEIEVVAFFKANLGLERVVKDRDCFKSKRKNREE
jgi:hypothetical protein